MAIADRLNNVALLTIMMLVVVAVATYNGHQIRGIEQRFDRIGYIVCGSLDDARDRTWVSVDNAIQRERSIVKLTSGMREAGCFAPPYNFEEDFEPPVLDR